MNKIKTNKAKKIKSRAGFTLVELMVVVAIIGILAAIAVPNMTKFRAKARQSGAKVELAGIYTAQKAFHVEYSSYSSDLVPMGFIPEGCNANGTCAATAERYYRVGFNNMSRSAAVASNNALPAGTVFAFPSNRSGNPAQAAGPTALPATNTAAQNTFTAGAAGYVSDTTVEDRWTINENKAVLNTQSGI